MAVLCSFILPTYNRADYLAEAINSVLEQTYKNFELIVVDDGSTDSTETLMEYFTGKDKRIKYLKKKNGGPASAMNYGIRHSKGSVLVFGASDDIQLPNKIKDSLEAIKGVDFAYSGYYHCNPKGEIWQYCPPKPLTEENIKACNCASGGSFVMTRKLWEKIPYREELRINEDLGTMIDVYNAKVKYRFLDIPTYKYRMLADGMSYARKKEVDELTTKLLKELK